MIDDRLLSRESLDFEKWCQTPNPDDLLTESMKREKKRGGFLEKVHDMPEAFIFTHGDADGLTSAALLSMEFATTVGTSGVAVLPVSYQGSYSLTDALSDLIGLGVRDGPIYITDLNPDDPEDIAPLDGLINDQGCEVTWYDHHQWDSATRDYAEAAGVDLVIDTEECAASLILEERDRNPPEYIKDLVEVTKDRDLWIRDDPRSDRLATYAEIAAPKEYINTVLEYGADLPDSVQGLIDDRQELDERIEQFAVESAKSWDVSGYSLAITYVSGGRSSNIGNTLTEEGPDDIAVVLRPAGGGGIYSNSDGETFDRCHEVAAKLGGGGHPTASGFGVEFQDTESLFDYWITKGRSVRYLVRNAVRDVVEE